MGLDQRTDLHLSSFRIFHGEKQISDLDTDKLCVSLPGVKGLKSQIMCVGNEDKVLLFT